MTTTATHAPLSFAPPAAKNQGLGEMVSTLVGSEILRIAGEVRVLVESGRPVLNLTVGDFAPSQFRIPRELESAIALARSRRGSAGSRSSLIAKTFVNTANSTDWNPSETNRLPNIIVLTSNVAGPRRRFR